MERIMQNTGEDRTRHLVRKLDAGKGLRLIRSYLIALGHAQNYGNTSSRVLNQPDNMLRCLSTASTITFYLRQSRHWLHSDGKPAR